MVFDRYENGFDNCVPPVCREDINIDIININCTEDKILYVDWTVSDLHNRSVDSNSLLWGCDNTSFNNIVDPLNNSNPFNSYFDVSSCDGIIYLKVKIRIETSFFESAECVYNRWLRKPPSLWWGMNQTCLNVVKTLSNSPKIIKGF